MLDSILQTLRDVEGVQGALVVDRTSTVVAQRAHAIYDLQVLQQVARNVTAAVDSIQLVQDDWDVLTAHYGDGKLLLRNLRVGGAKPHRYVLAVIADGRLNVAFLGVALRVAASKLIAELEAGPPTALGSASFTSAPARSASGADELRPEPVKSGMSWSSVGAGSDSGVISDVSSLDAATQAFLKGCTKALAKAVGPMAKVFVKDAIRKLCGDRPFTRADVPALLAQLANGIDDDDDRKAFQRDTRAL